MKRTILTLVIAVGLALGLQASAALNRDAGAPLVPLTHSLPAAYSGDAYLVTLNAEGGTGAHVCVPQELHVGSIHLTSACVLTGTAPVVATKSITGPFTFKMSDHSSPPKTVEFGPFNFTTIEKGWPLPDLFFSAPEFLVAIGEHVVLSYCRPAQVQGRSCGGPFVHGQANPHGGPSHGGPYFFRRVAGFFPPGLVLHSNGLLTGTVGSSAKTADNGSSYDVKICVSDWAAPSAVNSGVFRDGDCEDGGFLVDAKGTPESNGLNPKTTPKPKPKPTPRPAPKPTHPFDGTWQGAFTGSITETDQPDPFGDSGTFAVNDGGFTVDIAKGVLSIFYGTSMSFVGEPPIGADGSATLITSIPGEQETGGPDVTPCQFAIQFSGASADGVGQLSCKYSYVATGLSINGVPVPQTITYVYSGSFHMTRTSTP